jgi:hypothetical protein
MKAEITKEMITQPRTCIKQWQEIIDTAPLIAGRFHEDVMGLRSELQIPEAYYDAAAAYLLEHDVTTLQVDADLMVAFARRGVNYQVLRRRESYFKYGPFKNTKPSIPISIKTAMKLLQLNFTYTTFFGHAVPRTEKDLLYMVENTGTRSEVSMTKRKVLRTLFRRYTNLIKDPMKFVRLNQGWCTEAVFAKISLRERKTIAKEVILSGMEFSGVPIEVYTKTRERTPWILQSTEWNDKQKADFLNHQLMEISKSTPDGGRYGNSMFPRAWWSTEPDFDSRGEPVQYYRLKETFPGPTYYAGSHYGPLLFPEKVVIDLQGRLNSTGLRNLLGYLFVARLKVKVKLSELEKAALRDLHPDRLPHWKPEQLQDYKDKMEKHLL